jgi:hypothetical protein
MSDTATRPASNDSPSAVQADAAEAISSAAAPGHHGEDEIMAEPDNDDIQNLLPTVLSRLAAGLPMHELSTIIKEACACEDAL